MGAPECPEPNGVMLLQQRCQKFGDEEGSEGERREAGSLVSWALDGANNVRKGSRRTWNEMLSDSPLWLKAKPVPRAWKLISGLL